MKIHVIDINKEETIIELEPYGQSLMETLRDNNFPILGTCEGNSQCGTCVADIKGLDNSKIDHTEEERLSYFDNVHENTRLSCQVILKEDMKDHEDIQVTLRPDDY